MNPGAIMLRDEAVMFGVTLIAYLDGVHDKDPKAWAESGDDMLVTAWLSGTMSGRRMGAERVAERGQA